MQAIELTAQRTIEQGVVDVVGAIDGARLVGLIADACGCGWSRACIHMPPDIKEFQVPMSVGGGFADAQQNWPTPHA